MLIKILGTGCPNCQLAERLVRKVVERYGIQAGVAVVADGAEYQRYRLTATPGLVVDGELVCDGRVPREWEIKEWVLDALERQERQIPYYPLSGNGRDGATAD
ncbi:MAG: MTH895/ArsE family thioredoxin-like protein [Dehalococcoidales bacterium]|nr:MTH895/ArsE family thioredoxin-like protein [Dehalococcoidales bacterium]